MRIEQIEIVLTLADELHFGRTAERLYISQSRVSKLVAALERELGGKLFDRTSRRVALTPLGQRFVDRVGGAYRMLLDAAEEITRESRDRLRIGFTPTTGGTALGRLMSAFEHRHPDAEIELVQISYDDPYGELRHGAIDVLVLWRTEDQPGITVGPVIDRQDRVAAMAAQHPLAGESSISVLDVDNWVQAVNVAPADLLRVFLPDSTADGIPILRSRFVFRSIQEVVSKIARNQVVHATVTSFSEMANRDDLAYVPIRDLTPLDLCLIWSTAHETEAVRALARAAGHRRRSARS